jgi:hypothetical protein
MRNALVTKAWKVVKRRRMLLRDGRSATLDL